MQPQRHLVVMLCLAAPLVGGCKRPAATTESPATVVVAASAPATAVADPPAPEPKTCETIIRVGQMTKLASCEIDDKVGGRTGMVSFPCDGGDAVATFDQAVFKGVVKDGQVELELGTQFDFTDGCHWTSTQTIRGRLTGRMKLTYHESPADGQSGCMSPCHGIADVTSQAAQP